MGATPLKGSGYTSWFDETYKETYLILRRAGRILLAHLCPALLGDLDELLDCTYNRINYSYSISYNGTIGNEYRVYV